MIIVITLSVLFLVFVGIISMAPVEVHKIFLAGAWLVGTLGIVGTVIYHSFNALFR